MKKSVIFCLVAIATAACSKDKVEEVKKEKVEQTQRPNSLIIGDPLDCGLEGILMFPIGTSYEPEVFDPPPVKKAVDVEGNITYVPSSDLNTYQWSDNANNMTFCVNTGLAYDKNAAIEYINQQEEDFDITNILFYDLESGHSFPLIGNDTLHILSFAIHKEFDTDLIFYRAVRKDHNRDSKFNALDPIMLFVSTLDGKTLVQVTPNNEQFIDYTYYEENQKILAKTRIDADGDYYFTPADETNFVEMKLDSPSFGAPLFPEDLKNVLKDQLNL